VVGKEERRKVVDRFREGSLQFLCSCNLFLEGFDAPNTSVLVMARPTKSLPLYTQALGRGTRPLPGLVDGLDDARARRQAIAASGKPSLLVLDFAGNAGRHRIVSATDLLGGKYSPQVRDYARKTLEEEGTAAPTAEALERAALESALEEEDLRMQQELARRRPIVGRADYGLDRSPVFGGRRAPALSEHHGREPATDKQVWLLHRRFGVSLERAQSYTKRQASAVIDKLMKGEGKGAS
jgi:superfamily II DNA or RNA helicase